MSKKHNTTTTATAQHNKAHTCRAASWLFVMSYVIANPLGRVENQLRIHATHSRIRRKGVSLEMNTHTQRHIHPYTPTHTHTHTPTHTHVQNAPNHAHKCSGEWCWIASKGRPLCEMPIQTYVNVSPVSNQCLCSICWLGVMPVHPPFLCMDVHHTQPHNHSLGVCCVCLCVSVWQGDAM